MTSRFSELCARTAAGTATKITDAATRPAIETDRRKEVPILLG